MPEISLEHYSDLFGLAKSHDLTRLMTSISELSNAATGFDWGNYWCARPNYFEHISGVYLGWRGSELVAICAYQRWPFDGSVILYGDTVFVHPELQRSGIALRMWVRLLGRQLVIARGRTAYVAGRTDTPEMLEALNRYGQHMVWAPRADRPT
jgi:GNAT superfamily N-acetyltransferase